MSLARQRVLCPDWQQLESGAILWDGIRTIHGGCEVVGFNYFILYCMSVQHIACHHSETLEQTKDPNQGLFVYLLDVKCRTQQSSSYMPEVCK